MKKQISDKSKTSNSQTVKGVHKNVKSLVKERLGKDLLCILETISQVASRSGMTVFAVGGFIRDLLLNIPNKDIDIVVEGDGILFANHLAEKFDAKVQSYKMKLKIICNPII